MIKRIVDVLHRLLVTDYPLSIEQLAEETAASGRTIRNDLNEINTFLLTYTSDRSKPFEERASFETDLETASHRLAGITRTTVGIYDPWRASFWSAAASDLFKEILVLNKKEEAYQISKSSMDEDMRRLRADINKYGIEIISLGKRTAVEWIGTSDSDDDLTSSISGSVGCHLINRPQI